MGFIWYFEFYEIGYKLEEYKQNYFEMIYKYYIYYCFQSKQFFGRNGQ